MAYSSQTISGYNTSAPVDDGTQSEANKVKWSTIKSKLGDPVKTLAEAINTANVNAWADLAATTTDDGAKGFHLVSIMLTQAEVTAGVSPTNLEYPEGDALRYNVVADGVTDNAAALLNAKAVCAQANIPLILPSGTIAFSSQIDMSGIVIIGKGKNDTILYCDTALGSGTPALIIQSPSTSIPDATLRDLSVKGPGSYSLGTKTATCDGVRCDSKLKIENVYVYFFDSGVIFNSSTGHVTLDNCQISNNYYGVYYLQNNYDHFFHDCTIDGNSFANVAVPYNQSITVTAIRTHLGHAPYGIYQEDAGASTATNFLIDVNLFNCHFEAIGNGAIFTENAVDGTTEANSAFIRIYEPGFSWSAVTYYLASKADDYAVHLGYCTGHIIIEESHYPFRNGDVGAIHIAHQFATVRIHQSEGSGAVAGSAQKITIGGGNGDMITPVLKRPKTGTVLSGNTVVTIQSGYYGPGAGLNPVINWQANPGAYWWVDNKTNDVTTNEAEFDVNLSSAAGSNISFKWSLE